MVSTSAGSRFIRAIFFGGLLLFFFFSWPSLAAEKKRTLRDFPKAWKNSKVQLFPVPFLETDPASGQRYGLMPTLLWLDEKEDVITIGIASATYNPKVVKWGTFVGLFIYPSKQERFRIYYETAQHYIRDYYLEYVNENGWDGRLRLETEGEYIVDPFERFFGFGPLVTRQSETNFVSRLWFWKGIAAFEIFPKFELQLEENWQRMLLRRRALTAINDTATFFAANPEVRSSNQWVHRLSTIWDTRDSKDLPLTGNYVEPFFLLSQALDGGDTFYYGYGLRAKKLLTLKDRFTSVASFKVDQLIGDQVPFFMQPNLGGYKDLRAYVFRRFTGRGKLLLDLEERIRVKRWRLNNVNFDLSFDPFFSVGQVFNHWDEVAVSNWKVAGGMGFRARISPSILGRVDVGVGEEGLEVFTSLDYPF